MIIELCGNDFYGQILVVNEYKYLNVFGNFCVKHGAMYILAKKNTKCIIVKFNITQKKCYNKV